MTQRSTSRRKFIASTAGAVLLPRAVRRQGRANRRSPGAAHLTADQIADRIRANIGIEWRPQTVDGFKAGDPGTTITGIVTTVLATTDVLRRAAAAGQNLVITPEPLYYTPNEDAGNRATDPIYVAKKALVDEHHLVVYRFADHWTARRPNASANALAAALNWTNEVPDAPQTYRIAETTLDGLVTEIRNRLPIRGGLRIVGQPRLRVRTVYLAPGTASLAMAVANLQKADVILAGEPREWEAIPYTLDTWSSERGKGLIAIGRMVSENPGMAACAAWLRSFIPEVQVESIPVEDPYWSVNA